jgi:hypothetical protein
MEVQTVILYRAVWPNVLTTGSLIRSVLCLIPRVTQLIGLLYVLVHIYYFLIYVWIKFNGCAAPIWLAVSAIASNYQVM